MFDCIIQIKDASDDFKVRYCYLSPTLFDEISMRMEAVFIDFLYNDTPHPLKNKEDTIRIKHVFGLMQIIYEDIDNMYRRRIAINILQSFFFDLYNKVYRQIGINNHQGYNSKDKLIKSFFVLINTYYKEHRDVSFYADKLCISSRYLSMVTNSTTKYSPKKLIDDYIVLEIKVLLQSTDYTIQEISQHLNFTDQSVMGRFFKQHIGISAIEYRQMLKEKNKEKSTF